MKWFERDFDFSFDVNESDTICHHLRHTPARLQQLLSGFNDISLNNKPGGKWSIKEHVGHLTVMESLWRDRIEDFTTSKTVLTPADLDNRATHEANFNQFGISALLDRFLQERTATLHKIASADVKNEDVTILHPRLKKPMRIIDHLFFIAEHDDHHIGAMREIIHSVIHQQSSSTV